MDSDELTKFMEGAKCSGCGKPLEWEVYDEVTHDGEAGVRILGQCGNYPDCKAQDDMIEFIAVEWRKM